MKYTRKDFPDGFLFGAATSSYQIEGHSFGGAGETQWDTFAATRANVVRAQTGAIACDHFHRYEEDLDLVAAAGFDCYRFSTSWARILPHGRGSPNQQGLDFYDRLTDAMLERGLKPCLTLYHWEMPSALVDLGGWRNRDIAKWFGDYTEIIMSCIGDRMFSTAPINEPWCVAWLGHFTGQHAPGIRDIRATARAMHHVLVGHGTAISIMRGLGLGNLGAVCNLEYAMPADNSEAAERASELYDGIYNRFFLSGMFKGEYPANVLEGIENHLPTNWQDDFPIIQAPVDWCGINYYTRKLIGPTSDTWPAYMEVEGHLPKTDLGWEVFPAGLEHLLKSVQHDYTGDLPLYVTENGMANDDIKVGMNIDDAARIDYLNKHLEVVQNTLVEGVPVKGYFIWSLLDNYEWSSGYEKRFGIVHVDFETLKRTPKSSYHAIAKALLKAG